ncbi:hypothetical protein [Duganella vulcania]|uniref:Uncharacterized protein n=1 Tax=Duganella vulcania TaxID=2692166 RepID=A0A845GWU4_9BURK|nr:hypothetical protein [Duganella vulcania]MYM97127.1 hypothetical protein [Duganella vulcania]
MRFQAFPRHLALLALAAALNACGGGSSGTTAKPDATAATFTGTTPDTSSLIDVDGARQTLTLPGGAALKGMGDALIVGDHIVVRSFSDTTVIQNGNQVHPRTRLSVLDKDGALVSSIDYGFTLAAGYLGEWQMLPSPDGFVMVQSGPGAKLLHFDAQAKQIGGAIDLYPGVAPTSTTELAAAESSGAVDGNGFWLVTTFSLLPVTDKTQYLLKLCKFDFDGRQLTPPFEISTSALHPRVAASAGVVLSSWLEGGGAMVAMWPKGLGAPIVHTLGTSGALPYPVALDTSGKMGVLWNGKASLSSPGGVMGVALDKSGIAVLPADRTDLGQETLSGKWAGNGRSPDLDAHLYKGSLLLADVVVGSYKVGDPVGDVLVLGDYGVGTAALSAQKSTILRIKLTGTDTEFGGTAVIRQLMFDGHGVLLVGDEHRLVMMRIKRN